MTTSPTTHADPVDAAPAAGHHEPGQAPSGEVDWVRTTVLLSVAVGLTLRLLQYLANRSLWLDEALLASNTVNRSFAELLQPLSNGQTAPYGFLALERAAVLLLGANEYALRLAPLLAGILALFLFVPLARRFLSPRAAAVAVLLFALAPYLIYYASEAKQYSLDVVLSIGVLLVAHDLLEREWTRRRLLLLAALGVLGVWLSQPIVFVLAGTGSVLFLERLNAGERRDVGALVGIGAAWVLSFAGAYAISRATLADMEYMRAFWRAGFVPFPFGSLESLTWYPKTLARVFVDPLGVFSDNQLDSVTVVIAGIVASVLGTRWMLRSERRRGALLLAPLPFLLLASALKLYPIGSGFVTGGRVLLFLVPVALLLVAAGVERMLRRSLPLGALALGMLVLPSAAYAVLSVPHMRAEVKPLIDYARENWQEGDLLYVYYDAREQFRFYRERYGFEPDDFVIGECHRLSPRGYVADLQKYAGTPRLWVLFIGGEGAHGFDERGLMLGYLDAAAKRLDDQVAIGSSLYLYDFSAPREVVPTGRLGRLPYALEFDCRGPWQVEPEA